MVRSEERSEGRSMPLERPAMSGSVAGRNAYDVCRLLT